jgi:hypothetical protein
MTNPLKHAQELSGLSEAYQVVRTAIVVLDGHTYRIDVLKGYVPPTTAYTARCMMPRQMPAHVIAPLTPATGEPSDGTVIVWVEHLFSPPVAGDRPKQALADALSRLAAQRPAEAEPPAKAVPRPRTRRRAPVAASTKG